jgi:spermidine synthase
LFASAAPAAFASIAAKNIASSRRRRRGSAYRGHAACGLVAVTEYPKHDETPEVRKIEASAAAAITQIGVIRDIMRRSCVCPEYSPMHHRHFAALRFFAALALLALCAVAGAAEKVIYDKPSAYNNIIVTEDDNGFRVLRFERNGARQTIAKPGDPTYLGFAYTRVAFSGLGLADDPRRIMIVGLGGGTMPMFLRHYYPNAAIDVVDIDPDVVSVAKEFFGFREDANLRAHVGDGRKFVESVREPYDVVFLDAFGTRNVPPHLTTIEFMHAVRRSVKPGGVVIGNIWGRPANPLYDSMVRTYQEVFDELYILDVPGTTNKIMLALPRRQALDRPQLAQLARKVGTEKGFGFDAGDIAEDQFVRAARKGNTGRVLRDAESAKAREPEAVK